MIVRELNVGCVGGGTGLPSLLGGLKRNPWLRLHAVVTMFDSGGSSGQLRDELGVLPPGDVLKCALALARNEAEARRVLLSRVPSIDRGQSNGQFVKHIWLEPPAQIHPAVDAAIRKFDAVLIGPGSFYTSLMPIFLVDGVRDALQDVRGPVILITNLLTEGSGMNGFTAGHAVRQICDAIGRPVDVVIHNATGPSEDVLARYAAEEKRPLELGRLPAQTELIEGDFWQDEIARHGRRRLAAAVWLALGKRLL